MQYGFSFYFYLFQAQAGDNVGALLRGIKLKEIERGMLLCAVGSEKLSNRYKARVYFLTKSEGGRSKPILSKYIQQLFSKTWNAPCRIDLGYLQLTFILQILILFYFR